MNDDRKLWDLLGASTRPAAPPFFASKVLRSIRAGEDRSPAWLSPLLRWLAPASVAALFAAAVISQPGRDNAQIASASTEFTTLDLVEIVSPQDYEVLTTAGYPFNNGFLAAGL